ncbi:MAG: hypothetical protein M1826_006131 [Phylliscum demangeonii]|nr:MAG: hypothetical protein M1826_006131 [Phylliscum demangeonii]
MLPLSPRPPLPAERVQLIRTPTPPAVLPSSPPPTIDRGVAYASHLSTEIVYGRATSTDSVPELQTRLERSAAEVARLVASLADARTTAAHYQLQHHLLSIEMEEATERMAVEHAMMRREVDVLQAVDPSPRRPFPLPDAVLIEGRVPPSPLPSRVTIDLKRRCHSLETEKDRLKATVRRAKKVIRLRDGEIASLLMETDRLRTRIKENREHFDRVRALGGGPADRRTSHAPDPHLRTPQRHATQRADDARSAYWTPARPGGEDTFAALLLADQVLRREDASAHSTPLSAAPARTQPAGHTRGTQSLSSLPSTPAPAPAPTVLPLPHLTPSSPARSRKSLMRPLLEPPAHAHAHAPAPRRRQSRDSTISASDVEPAASSDGRKSPATDDVIGESNASQLATHQLRPPPVASKTRAGSAADKAKDKVKVLAQARIVGSITKPRRNARSGAGKERTAEGTDGPTPDEPPAKKVKSNRGIGLGIGVWKGP